MHSRGKEKTISEHLDYAVNKMTEFNQFRAELCKIINVIMQYMKFMW